MSFNYPTVEEVADAMSIASSPIPAGWYPDPAGSFQQRWWTGESWTNDFAQYRPTLIHSAPTPELILNHGAQPQMNSSSEFLQQQAAATTVAAQANGQQAGSYTPTQTLTRQEPAAAAVPAFRLPDADQPPQTTVAQPNAGNASLIAVAPSYRMTTLNANAEPEYSPFGSIREDHHHGHRLNPERRYTVAVWVLAVLPLALVAAGYALATFMPVLYTTFAQALIVALFLVASTIFAALDRRTLRLAGHVSTASPALALLTPLVWMPVRTGLSTRETDRNTMAPLILLLVVAAGITAALVVVPGLTSLLLTTTALY